MKIKIQVQLIKGYGSFFQEEFNGWEKFTYCLSFLKMASGSLRIREELVWEPDYVDEYYVPPSPPFLYMNLKWKLKICSHYDYVDHSSKLSYKIYLINQDERLHEPFKVSTFIEDRKSNVRLQCSTMTISSIEESLYKVSADSIPELSILKQAAVIVRFFPSTGLAVREETANGE